MIGRDETNRILTELSAAHERIAAVMFALDNHRGLAVLRRGGLAGLTQGRWRELQPAVDRLWAHFATLGAILEQVRAVLGRVHLDDAARSELSRLLTQPSVALDRDGMPLGTDGTPPVPGAATVATWLAVDRLAEELEQRGAEVLSQLSEVEVASTAITAAVVKAAEAVEAVTALAGSLGATELGERLRNDLADIERAGLADPLSAAPGGRLTDSIGGRLNGLAEAAEQARQKLAEMVTLRDGYPGRRAALAALIDEVAAAEETVARAQARVAEKIADPGLSPRPDATSVLRARLAEFDGLADRQAWSHLAAHVSVVEESARHARERAEMLVTNAEGLLARRDELRGRLAAYRAKAAARGLAEDDQLTTLHARAHALLFTAPCDLRASTRAVHAYQVAVASGRPGGERSSGDD